MGDILLFFEGLLVEFSILFFSFLFFSPLIASSSDFKLIFLAPDFNWVLLLLSFGISFSKDNLFPFSLPFWLSLFLFLLVESAFLVILLLIRIIIF